MKTQNLMQLKNKFVRKIKFMICERINFETKKFSNKTIKVFLLPKGTSK